MTHIKSKEMFKSGDVEGAWNVAQMDDGWIGDITRDEWVKWMTTLV